jgi:hypothetical protein
MRFSLLYTVGMNKPFTLTSENVHEVIQNLIDSRESEPKFHEFHFSRDYCKAMGYSDEAIEQIRSAGYLR